MAAQGPVFGVLGDNSAVLRPSSRLQSPHGGSLALVVALVGDPARGSNCFSSFSPTGGSRRHPTGWAPIRRPRKALGKTLGSRKILPCYQLLTSLRWVGNPMGRSALALAGPPC
jgi:hypothetical protein